MAKRIDVQIYSSTNSAEKWILDKERSFESLWELHYGENPQQPAMIFQTENMANYEVIDTVTEIEELQRGVKFEGNC